MSGSEEVSKEGMNEEGEDEMNEQENVQIEVRELGKTEVSEEAGEGVDPRVLILKKILIEFDDWLSNKPRTQLNRLVNMDNIDIIITFISDMINSWYGRLRKLQSTMTTLDRMLGGGRAGGMSLRSLESILAERLYQSLTGAVTQTVEAQAEAQRRKTLAEEVLSRYLKERGELTNEDKGGGK